MGSESLILGFDTSAAHCAAALLRGDHVVAEAVQHMPTGQAEQLMPMIGDLLREAGLRWQDVARIGVGIGPGNFTGVRISVAAARGLALALNVPAIGVSSFDALAEGQGAPVLAAVDARRGQCHLRDSRTADDAAVTVALPPDGPGETLPFAQTRLDVVGHEAAILARITGGAARPARYPLAVAIARIAARASLPQPRPAPMYLRAADAVRTADPPPVIGA